MDFGYTPEQEAFRSEVRTWLEANQPPPLTREEKQKLTDDLLWERGKAWHTKLYEGGWAGISWPKQVWRARRHLYRAGDLRPGTGAA